MTTTRETRRPDDDGRWTSGRERSSTLRDECGNRGRGFGFWCGLSPSLCHPHSCVRPLPEESMQREGVSPGRKRRSLLTLPAVEAQYQLAPELVKVVVQRGEGLNDFGAQTQACAGVYPYAEIVLLPSNLLVRLERNAWPADLRLLDLSFNKISTLPDGNFWGQLPRLQVLYLHGNSIVQWDAILGLTQARGLVALTLHDNTLSTHERYRHFMVNHFDQLLCLDGHVVTDGEIIEGVNTFAGGRFDPLGDATKVPGMYTLTDEHPLHSNGISADGPPRRKKKVKGLGERTATWLLQNFDRLVSSILKIHRSCSAVITIQRYFRGYRGRMWSRHRAVHGAIAATEIQKVARGFLLRRRVEHELKLALGDDGAALLVSEHDRIRGKAASVIQAAWRKGCSEVPLPTDARETSNILDTLLEMSEPSVTLDHVMVTSTSMRMDTTDMDKQESLQVHPTASVAPSSPLPPILPPQVQFTKVATTKSTSSLRGTMSPMSRSLRASSSPSPLAPGVPDTKILPVQLHVSPVFEELCINGVRPRPSSAISIRDMGDLARAEGRYLANRRDMFLAHDMAAKAERAHRLREARAERGKRVYARRQQNNVVDGSTLRRATEDAYMKDAQKAAEELQRVFVEEQRMREREAVEVRRENLQDKKKHGARIRDQLHKDITKAREIVLEQERQQLERKSYAVARALAVKKRRAKDRQMTARFARASVAMSRHVQKGINMSRRSAEQMQRQVLVHRAQTARASRREHMEESLKHKWIRRAQMIDQGKAEHVQRMAWRHEKYAQQLGLQRMERKLLGDMKDLGKMIRDKQIDMPDWPTHG